MPSGTHSPAIHVTILRWPRLVVKQNVWIEVINFVYQPSPYDKQISAAVRLAFGGNVSRKTKDCANVELFAYQVSNYMPRVCQRRLLRLRRIFQKCLLLPDGRFECYLVQPVDFFAAQSPFLHAEYQQVALARVAAAWLVTPDRAIDHRLYWWRRC
jgi:hypothetical protein